MEVAQREEFLKVAREGLKEYGACNGVYQNSDGCCCAVGSYRKKKFGDAYSPEDDFDVNYVSGVITGFDNIDYSEFNHRFKQEFLDGVEDGKKLREEFIK